jgi:glycosyltransferase involved in cell wall biosynthesis
MHGPKHILMTTDSIGGVWTFTYELVSELVKEGIEVTLVSLGKKLSRDQRLQIRKLRNVHLHDTDFKLEWMEDAESDLQKTRDLISELERKIHPDLLHLNTFLRRTDWSDTPTLLTIHSCVFTWYRAVHGNAPVGDWRLYEKEVRGAINQATVMTTPTAALRRALLQEYPLRGRVDVIPNGRDPSRFAPAPKEPFLFASGRLWDEGKNITLLSSIAERLPWPLLLAGATSDPSGKQRIRAPENTQVLGAIEADDMARLLGECSIYVSPALYEPFGLAILEAAFSECALVLSDLESMQEIWGDAALYFDSRSAEDLLEKIQFLVDHPKFREELARRARARALARYTSEKMAGKYAALYRELTVEPSRPARGRMRPVGIKHEIRPLLSFSHF